MLMGPCAYKKNECNYILRPEVGFGLIFKHMKTLVFVYKQNLCLAEALTEKFTCFEKN